MEERSAAPHRLNLRGTRAEILADCDLTDAQLLVDPRAQRTVRLPEHTKALENVVLGAFNTDRPCRRKVNRPPSHTALALAAELLGDRGADRVIDLDVYRRAIDGENVG